MEELNNMNLDELLNTNSSNGMGGKLFEDADIDVVISKDTNVPEGQMSLFDDEVKCLFEEDVEMTVEQAVALDREEAMKKLAEYEALQNKNTILNGELTSLTQELDELISKIKLENKELIDRINAKSNEIEANNKEQDRVKEELLPLQRRVYNFNNNDKTLKFNKIQSTYVAATEKNKFDLKKFREEQPEFWKTNLEVLKPYSEITTVSDYLKVTISKK